MIQENTKEDQEQATMNPKKAGKVSTSVRSSSQLSSQRPRVKTPTNFNKIIEPSTVARYYKKEELQQKSQAKLEEKRNVMKHELKVPKAG